MILTLCTAPCVRPDGAQVHPGAELRRSLEETPTFQRMYPALYEYLMTYPRVAPPRRLTRISSSSSRLTSVSRADIAVWCKASVE